MYNAEIGMTTFNIFNEGWLKLKFGDGEIFSIKYPEAAIKGMVTGSRIYRLIGSVVCF